MDSPHTTQRADAVGGPTLALAGRYTHAVQRGGDVLVRPSCRHAMDQGHRLFGRSAAVFAGFWFADAELRVLATAPMDGEDDLARALVIVRDDVDNECTQKLLARLHRHARGIPCGLEVFRE